MIEGLKFPFVYCFDSKGGRHMYTEASYENSLIELFQGMGYRQTGSLSDWLFDGKTYHDAIVLQRLL